MYEDLPDRQRRIAGSEDILDTQRESGREDDTPVDRAARKYLKSRGRRIDIEYETGSRIDAFPYRLIELLRAKRFARLAGIELENKGLIDDMLPTLARITLDEINAGKIH